MRNYKFRLYPTREVEQKLVETLEINRVVYNYFVSSNLRSRNDMNYALTELKERQPILRKYHSKMLQMVSTKVAAAWRALEVLEEHGRRTGSLKFCKPGKCNSFTYNQSGFRIENDKLWLLKIGSIKIVLHRQPTKVKQVMVVRQARKWYAVVTCEIAKSIFRFVDTRKSIGIDVGITKFAYDSDDHEIDNPLFLSKMIRPLRRAQRKVSRRKRGSNNRKKAKSWVAHLYQRIANKRHDFLHKLSTEYASKYDLIFLERLRISNMVKNHHVARHIMDSGWGTFKTMLEYKAKMVVGVGPAYTSINCSKCGNTVPKTLAVRLHRCNKCGLTLDRDYNASLNILNEGLTTLPQGLREFTPVEIAPLLASVGVQARSLKQEASLFKAQAIHSAERSQ
ncbi:transposase [Candidatus Nitrososphaera evergladensis]|nr:transposase [Candidatus Nitrososphaera evergladensis]